MRLSIEVSLDQHQHQHQRQRLKASAALQGKSIKDYILEKILPDVAEESALYELEEFLKPRVEAADKEDFLGNSVDEIFAEAAKE